MVYTKALLMHVQSYHWRIAKRRFLSPPHLLFLLRPLCAGHHPSWNSTLGCWCLSRLDLNHPPPPQPCLIFFPVKGFFGEVFPYPDQECHVQIAATLLLHHLVWWPDIFIFMLSVTANWAMLLAITLSTCYKKFFIVLFFSPNILNQFHIALSFTW